MADDEKLLEGIELSPRKRHLRDWGDKVFRYCTFDDIDHDGCCFDGAMIHCTLRRVTLYWGFFNTATLQSVELEDFVFPGTSFRGCTFTDCTFTRCRFVLDNLGGSCTIDGCVLTGCVFRNCTFEHRKTAAEEREPERDGQVPAQAARVSGPVAAPAADDLRQQPHSRVQAGRLPGAFRRRGSLKERAEAAQRPPLVLFSSCGPVGGATVGFELCMNVRPPVNSVVVS